MEEPGGTQTCCCCGNFMDCLSSKQGQKQEHEDREGAALLERLTEQSLLEKRRLKGNVAVIRLQRLRGS